MLFGQILAETCEVWLAHEKNQMTKWEYLQQENQIR
jgi:hypothetical protein